MHYEKIANGGEFGEIGHNSRLFIHHSNENIDPERLHLNYNLTAIELNDGKTDYQRFKDRLGQCSYRKQRNNVRMAEIVIYAPKTVPKQDWDKFFKVARAELIRQTGGPANEVYAWVHMDEGYFPLGRGGMPHMHFGFVPAVEVDGVLKLSAKRVMNRAKLNRLHDDMQKAVDKAFGGHKHLVVADDPADRAKGSAPMKAYKALQQMIGKSKDEYANIVADSEFAKLQWEIDEQEHLKRLERTNKAIDKNRHENNDLTSQNSELRRQNSGLQRENNNLRKDNSSLKQQKSDLLQNNDRLEKESAVLNDKWDFAKAGLLAERQEWTAYHRDNFERVEFLEAFHEAVNIYEPEFLQTVYRFLADNGLDPDEWPDSLYNDDEPTADYNEYEPDLY